MFWRVGLPPPLLRLCLPILHALNTDICVKNKNINEDTVTNKRKYNENNINAFKSAVKNLSRKKVHTCPILRYVTDGKSVLPSVRLMAISAYTAI